MLTQRDARILVFINRFGFLCARHVIKYFTLNERVAYRRIAAMEREGYLHRRRVIPGRPKVLLLTQKAVETVPTNHARARIRLQTVEHDLLVADVLLALDLRYGSRFKTEREIRSETGISAKAQIPDALIYSGERLIALEVENSYKPAARHQKIIRRYIRRREIGEVLYVCYNQQQAKRILEIARKMKADSLVNATTIDEVMNNAGS